MFTWKVGVEVLALLHVDPSRGIAVPVQEVVDVILTPVPGGFRLMRCKDKDGQESRSPAQGNEGKIRRDGSIVGICGCGIIGKWPVSNV